MDRLRPEPRGLIALTFLLGCVSTIPAGIGNFVLGIGEMGNRELDLTPVPAAMFLVSGAVEEVSKFGAVRLGAYRSLYFDEPVDGLVYAAAASLGFASLENLLYVLIYGPEVMLVRAPLSTVAHLVFGSIWGYALGRHYVSRSKLRPQLVGSLALAAGVHGLFNTLISSVSLPGMLGAILLVALGGCWAGRAFRRGQQNSPFRYRRNYPRVECPKCGALVIGFSRFCNSCGVSLSAARGAVICSHCGRRNQPEAAFCTACGDQLLRQRL